MQTHEKIKTLRKEAGLIQDEVALATGIPRSTYARLEKPCKHKAEHLKAIADFYKINVSELADDETYFVKLLKEQGYSEPTPTILHEHEGIFLDDDTWINSTVVTNNERKLIKFYRIADNEEKKLIMELAKKLGTK